MSRSVADYGGVAGSMKGVSRAEQERREGLITKYGQETVHRTRFPADWLAVARGVSRYDRVAFYLVDGRRVSGEFREMAPTFVRVKPSKGREVKLACDEVVDWHVVFEDWSLDEEVRWRLQNALIDRGHVSLDAEETWRAVTHYRGIWWRLCEGRE